MPGSYFCQDVVGFSFRLDVEVYMWSFNSGLVSLCGCGEISYTAEYPHDRKLLKSMVNVYSHLKMKVLYNS